MGDPLEKQRKNDELLDSIEKNVTGMLAEVGTAKFQQLLTYLVSCVAVLDGVWKQLQKLVIESMVRSDDVYSDEDREDAETIALGVYRQLFRLHQHIEDVITPQYLSDAQWKPFAHHLDDADCTMSQAQVVMEKCFGADKVMQVIGTED